MYPNKCSIFMWTCRSAARKGFLPSENKCALHISNYSAFTYVICVFSLWRHKTHSRTSDLRYNDTTVLSRYYTFILLCRCGTPGGSNFVSVLFQPPMRVWASFQNTTTPGALGLYIALLVGRCDKIGEQWERIGSIPLVILWWTCPVGR